PKRPLISIVGAQTMDVSCPYCSALALRMTGRELHPSRPDLANMRFHVCRNCDAWIGCVEGSWEPVAPLANAELRRAKQDAHAAVEPIWQAAVAAHNWAPSKARSAAYAWLASEMGLGPKPPRIANFDLKQCEVAILICKHRNADLQKAEQQLRKRFRPWKNYKRRNQPV